MIIYFIYFRTTLGESQRNNAMTMQINPITNEIVADRLSFGKKLYPKSNAPTIIKNHKIPTGITYTEGSALNICFH